MSQSVSLYVLANNGGITLLEKSPDTVNALLCGGDNYHLDKAEAEMSTEKINSMLVLGGSGTYTRYSYLIAEEFDINQLILYDDGTDSGWYDESDDTPATMIQPGEGLWVYSPNATTSLRFPGFSL